MEEGNKGIQSIQLDGSCVSSYMIWWMHDGLRDYYLPNLPMLPYILFSEKHDIMNGLVKQK